MKLLSLNIGKPQHFEYKGKQITTSIYKHPVNGKRNVSLHNIDGDAQSDLTNHGGKMKAVYAYDISNYQFWKDVIERHDWTYGLFGENLTTSGLEDKNIFLGDIFKIGTVYFKAVQPRFPCYKLNIRFNREDMLPLFTQHQRNGTYFSVVQPGNIEAGDEIILAERSNFDVTIQQMVEAYYNKGTNKELLQKILAIDFLPERLLKAFRSY